MQIISEYFVDPVISEGAGKLLAKVANKKSRTVTDPAMVFALKE
jgi:hypothetical protein